MAVVVSCLLYWGTVDAAPKHPWDDWDVHGDYRCSEISLCLCTTSCALFWCAEKAPRSRAFVKFVLDPGLTFLEHSNWTKCIEFTHRLGGFTWLDKTWGWTSDFPEPQGERISLPWILSEGGGVGEECGQMWKALVAACFFQNVFFNVIYAITLQLQYLYLSCCPLLRSCNGFALSICSSPSLAFGSRGALRLST